MKKLFITFLLFCNTLFAQNLDVFFDPNCYDIKQSEVYKLDKYVDFLFSNPDLSVLLEGHADSIGTYEYNLNLSLKRVQAVKKYFVTKGILNSRVKTTGSGEMDPKVSNMLKSGRAINRRVTAKIIEER